MVLESGLNRFSLEQLTLGPRHPENAHTHAEVTGTDADGSGQL